MRSMYYVQERSSTKSRFYQKLFSTKVICVPSARLFMKALNDLSVGKLLLSPWQVTQPKLRITVASPRLASSQLEEKKTNRIQRE